jgi:signal transduction histidine kinase
MDRMMTLSSSGVTRAKRLRANWPALLLPVPVAGLIGLAWSPQMAPWAMPVLVVLVALAVAAALRFPSVAAQAAPFAWFGYGCLGFVIAYDLPREHFDWWLYGVVTTPWIGHSLDYVLLVTFLIMVVAVGLLVLAAAPGSNAVRRAAHQVFGTGGQPRTVPALLLLPVIGLWEESCASLLWFGSIGGKLAAILIVAAGVALVRWRQRLAGIFAVLGLIALGLVLNFALSDWDWAISFWALHGGPAWTPQPTILPPGIFSGLNGLVVMDTERAVLLTRVEGWVLVAAGCALAPRLFARTPDAQLARRAAALTQRVDRLARTRRDATDTAIAELRRIERDLHDGAQARLVAVGMSLRAAEQLMPSSPEAALALVAEARQTSSRALDDLRSLVRAIYPPVLADRGLGDAVRALALDASQDVETDIVLPGEPPMPVAAAVYFGIAEALTNAVRHADADTVQIAIGYAGGLLRATVTDDGAGGVDPSRGTGLAGVERRLATFDGVLAVTSPVGGPTIVVLEVPCALAG